MTIKQRKIIESTMNQIAENHKKNYLNDLYLALASQPKVGGATNQLYKDCLSQKYGKHWRTIVSLLISWKKSLSYASFLVTEMLILVSAVCVKLAHLSNKARLRHESDLLILQSSLNEKPEASLKPQD